MFKLLLIIFDLMSASKKFKTLFVVNMWPTLYSGGIWEVFYKTLLYSKQILVDHKWEQYKDVQYDLTSFILTFLLHLLTHELTFQNVYTMLWFLSRFLSSSESFASNL